MKGYYFLREQCTVERMILIRSEAWDAISRYIYSALQGGAIDDGLIINDKVMITCCK